MARQIIVLALIFFAIIGMASAAADAPSSLPSTGDLGPSAGEDIIGTTDGDSDAAPVGGPVPAGTFPNPPPSQALSSASTSIQVSTFAGVIFTALVGTFFF